MIIPSAGLMAAHSILLDSLGDHTIEAIEAGVIDVAESDSDDYFVIVISDANFERCAFVSSLADKTPN